MLYSYRLVLDSVGIVCTTLLFVPHHGDSPCPPITIIVWPPKFQYNIYLHLYIQWWWFTILTTSYYKKLNSDFTVKERVLMRYFIVNHLWVVHTMVYHHLFFTVNYYLFKYYTLSGSHIQASWLERVTTSPTGSNPSIGTNDGASPSLPLIISNNFCYNDNSYKQVAGLIKPASFPLFLVSYFQIWRITTLLFIIPNTRSTNYILTRGSLWGSPWLYISHFIMSRCFT